MLTSSLKQLRRGLIEDEDLSNFQRSLLAVHLQRVCVPLVAAVGLFTVFHLLTMGQLGLWVMPASDWLAYNRWRFIVCALNIWMVLAVTSSKVMRRNFHTRSPWRLFRRRSSVVISFPR